jgi:hypothetical protein
MGRDHLLEQVPHPNLAGGRLPRRKRDHLEQRAGRLGRIRTMRVQDDGGWSLGGHDEYLLVGRSRD